MEPLIPVLVTFRFGGKSITMFIKATPDGDGWFIPKNVINKQAVALGLAPGEQFTVTPATN